jgi:hypothetical protein
MTGSTSNNDKKEKMNTPLNKPMVFQWIKGESQGKFVRSTGKTVNDGMTEYLIFEDGSQCNVQLIGEWLIPMEVPDPYVAAKPATQPEAPTPQPISQKEAPAPISNPVYDLLKMSKKKPSKIQLNITIDMPSEELIKIIEDSYEGGEESIKEYLVSTVDQKSVMKQIEEILGQKVQATIKKKKVAKNESTI